MSVIPSVSDEVLRRVLNRALPDGMPRDSVAANRIMQLMAATMGQGLIGLTPETLSLAAVLSARQAIANGTLEARESDKLDGLFDQLFPN